MDRQALPAVRSVEAPMRQIAREILAGPLRHTRALTRETDDMTIVAAALTRKLHAQLLEAAALAERITRHEQAAHRRPGK